MPWYKAGTVSVVQNSNAVIGAGTSFIANSRVGDAFRGPDGGWYEVTNIASDTALSIAPNYQGSTNASGAYALAPMQGYVKDSADALRALVNQFGEQLAGLTDTDGLPEGSSNKYCTRARMMAELLTGISFVDSAVLPADGLLVALGKLQGQVSAKLPAAGGKLTGALNLAVPVSLASAAVVAIGAAAANTIGITGTTGIQGFDVIAAGARRTLVFAAALTLTHNATSLLLPGAQNVITAAGDSAVFESLGGGSWRCLSYYRASAAATGGVGRGYIDGLVMEFVSLTSIKIKAGSAFVPALGRNVTLTADKTLSPTLSASAFHHVYLFDNAGVGDIEISSTALPDPYFGSASQKTGDATRRYIGSFLTANNAAIWKFHHEGRRNFIRYIENLTTAPFLVLTGTAATTPTSVSCAAVVARSGHTVLASVYAGTGLYFSSSDSPTALSSTSWGVGYSTGPTTQYDLYLSRGAGVEQQFRYFGLAAAAVFTLVHGYYFDR
ncbi:MULTISPECIES: hypothetical protein [unclassified Pseudomonas]|uniref:hypothetical protein n=1 Tax=unclassified Pseudomonas TaxID=196821 RepID=UPI0021156069|nr:MULTISPECIES: hypothetical protein [unclassified Pseudomonas]